MNILYILDQWPRSFPGFIYYEIRELVERGHSIVIFALNDGSGDTHSEFEQLPVEVEYAHSVSPRDLPGLLSGKILNERVLQLARFREHPRKYLYWLLLGKQIAETMDGYEIDLLHAHFAVPKRMAMIYAAAAHDLPCTAVAHAYEIYKRPDTNGVVRICQNVDHLIAPSEYNRHFLSRDLGIDTDISVVPATIDTADFHSTGAEVDGRLLTVGRLVEKKGHEYAIQAVSELLASGYAVEYHIVYGSGNRERYLKTLVDEHGISDAVEFHQNVSETRLKQELDEAAVFLLPCVIAADGDRDAMPVVLKEAMAMNTACVSTTVSAIPELITDGFNGVLVPPNDSTALADATSDLLDNKAKRRRIAQRGKETVEASFDISKSVDTLLGVFETLT